VINSLWQLEYNDEHFKNTEAFDVIIMVLLKIQIFTDVPYYQSVNSYRSFEGSRSHLLGLLKRNLVILIKSCAFVGLNCNNCVIMHGMESVKW